MIEKYVVCFGEILWDNLDTGKRLGGAPLNVCYHLNKLGVDGKIVAQIGADEDGRAILQELKHLKIDSSFCSITASKPTSTVEVLLGDNQDIRYEILEDVAWDYIESSPAIEELVDGASALVFGSLIARNTVSRKTLFRLVQRSTFNVFDVNLREPYFTKELILDLLKVTHLLKLNAEELNVISQWLGAGQLESNRQVLHLQQHFPSIQEIILTLGAEGARYYAGEQRVTVEAKTVDIKDTVGSGDAFLAGFLAHKIKGSPIHRALQAGSSLSSFVASRQGACPEYELGELSS